jgi:tRNA A-37 threonylcarbamoyl transferase component Bud32
MEVVNAVGYTWAVPIIGWTTMVLLVIAKRFRHLLVYFGALIVISALVVPISWDVSRTRPWGLEQLAPWAGFSHPSLPDAQLTAVLVGAAYSLIPDKARRKVFGFLIGGVVSLFGLSRFYLAVEYPTDLLYGATIGATITAAAFLLICPEKVFPIGFQSGRTAHLDLGGARGAAIKNALVDQLGIEIVDVKPVGLADSAGSTPMCLTPADPDTPTLFGKLYASSHLRSDRWYKLGRTLLYGRLEDESRFQNVRRLVEREDYLLRLMQAAGIRSAAPMGIAVITPEREYLIVTEFLENAVEVTDAEVDEAVIDDALLLVRQLWDHGLAHRDIKPSNVMIRDNQAYVIDVAFGQVRPSPWREAVDLANMMLSLGLRSSSELVYDHARRMFTEREIAEAFAASRGITLPSQLRRELKADARDLAAEFQAYAPATPRLSIQRWSLRRIALALWVLVLVVLGVSFGIANLRGIGLL